MKGLFGVLILLLAAGSLFYIGERLSLVALLGVKCQRLAIKELEFLVSLLPKDKRKCDA